MRERNKFGVRTDPAGIEARTMDGITFDSKRECQRYAELKMLERSGIIFELELQPVFPITVNGVYITTYVADFKYIDQSNRGVVEDVKGVRTREYAIKARLMLAQGIRIVET